jgi:hypothetical protein
VSFLEVSLDHNAAVRINADHGAIDLYLNLMIVDDDARPTQLTVAPDHDFIGVHLDLNVSAVVVCGTHDDDSLLILGLRQQAGKCLLRTPEKGCIPLGLVFVLMERNQQLGGLPDSLNGRGDKGHERGLFGEITVG